MGRGRWHPQSKQNGSRTSNEFTRKERDLPKDSTNTERERFHPDRKRGGRESRCEGVGAGLIPGGKGRQRFFEGRGGGTRFSFPTDGGGDKRGECAPPLAARKICSKERESPTESRDSPLV